ncbi:MAG: minichromosome maintenance protein MCM [Candidatus Micrarchaeota archaeon]
MVGSEEIQAFEEYFSQPQVRPQIIDIASNYPQTRSLMVDVTELGRFNPDLADALVEKPDAYQHAAEDAVESMGLAMPGEKKKFRPHVRFFNLPGEPVLVKNLGSEHLNKLVTVQGVVDLMTDIRPKMSRALWECVHCGNTVMTVPDKSSLTPPMFCPSPGCERTDFRLVEAKSEFVNTQYGQMQDFIERVVGSSTPAHVDLWFEDDLTNIVTPGEGVSFTGVLRLMPRREPGKTKTPIYSKAFDVMHVRKEEREFEEIEISKEEEEKLKELSKNPKLRELIIASIAPSIFGHTELKEAIALQLFGGTADKVLPDGQRIRSDIHLLLVGDPGVAKSRILQYTEHLAPKCIYVAGGSTSGVGLTASAEKDKGGEGWILKAGALVLASGGMVAIDEFDKMKEDDRGAIHEALEQQTISIAKAGIVTKFRCKTSVLAAANPDLGRFDPTQPVARQFKVPPALLSRFDLIFTLKDVIDESKDRKMAEHILVGHKFASRKEGQGEVEKAIIPPIDEKLLRKYIAFARRSVFPGLSDEAASRIEDFYIDLRRLGEKENTFPVTPRDLEGLVRLSEASAKLRLSPKVELQDAEIAIRLKDYVLKDVFIDRATGKLDSDIIALGQPKAKIDKQRAIMGIISRLEEKVDLVAIEDVFKEAIAAGLDEQYARRMLDDLLRQGELYKPKPGFIKSARSKGW